MFYTVNLNKFFADKRSSLIQSAECAIFFNQTLFLIFELGQKFSIRMYFCVTFFAKPGFGSGLYQNRLLNVVRYGGNR